VSANEHDANANADSTRIIVELQPGRSLRGQIAIADRQARPFNSWIELLIALDETIQLLERQSSETGENPRP
jgi:hypothetical protein